MAVNAKEMITVSKKYLKDSNSIVKSGKSSSINADY